MEIAPNLTLLVQFLQFLVLLILFNFLLFKPIMNALKKRQGAIDTLANESSGESTRSRSHGKIYEEQFRERKLPVTEERDSLLKQAQSASMKTIEAARQELAEELVKIKDSVKVEADRALDALKGEADRLASEVVEKIMKRSTR